MKKYECEPCGYIYDPEVGDPDNGIAAGTACLLYTSCSQLLMKARPHHYRDWATVLQERQVRQKLKVPEIMHGLSAMHRQKSLRLRFVFLLKIQAKAVQQWQCRLPVDVYKRQALWSLRGVQEGHRALQTGF